MSKIVGKYELVENKNFYEYMVGIGFPEDHAKLADAAKGILEVTLDGKKLRMANTAPDYVTNLVIGEEVEENVIGGTVLKSTTTQNGDVIKISSKALDGSPSGSRTLTFSDKGLEVVLNYEGLSATRVYKRI